MRFRNSILLLIQNFKNVYRILAYKLIILLIGSALTSAFLIPGLIEIFDSAQFAALSESVKEFFLAFFPSDGNTGALVAAKDALLGDNGTLEQFIAFVASKATGIVWTIVGCVIVYLLQHFADTLCYFSIGGLLNDKMATYAESSFSSVYVTNLGKASLYSLVYVPSVFLFDVLTGLLCILLLTSVNIILALFLSLTVIVACQACKLTFTGMWLPSLVTDDKKLKEAIFQRSAEEKKQWPRVFATYVTTVYAIIIVNVIGAISTFGSALLITVPASYFMLICVQFVNYYTLKGKKYFITYDSIETNEAHGDSEHFFDYIEET